jgi:hypothetical protein
MAEHCARFTAEYENKHRSDRSAFHIHQRAHAMTAVTEAVAFIEALINEFYVDIRDSHANRYDSLGEDTLKRIREFWEVVGSGNNVSILTKYEMARSLCGHGTYDEGRDPYQSMKAAIDLRNWQMHYRPKDVGEASSHDVAKRLQSCRGGVRRVGRGLRQSVRRRLRRDAGSRPQLQNRATSS